MAKSEIQKVEQTPLMPIISAASTNGEVDADKLLKLLEANERYEKNEARKAYHVAMAAFQQEAPKIIKDKQAHNSMYASLPTVVSTIAPILSKNGLSHSWVTERVEDDVKVTCRLTHVLGHSEETWMSAGADTTGSKNAVQALGSTITYLQRYTLKSALGLAEEDDDGNAAGKKNRKKPNAEKLVQTKTNEIGSKKNLVAAINKQLGDNAPTEKAHIAELVSQLKEYTGLEDFNEIAKLLNKSINLSFEIGEAGGEYIISERQ
jgi:hypothetical protein